MATATDILNLAVSYLGVKENPPNSNNVIFNTHYYGGPVNNKSLHWCVAFVWDIFRMARASALFYGGGKTASCSTLWAYHKKQGQAVTSFQPGDIVFFDFSGKRSRTEHVGIVEKVENGYINTIDGNTGTTSEANGGAVMRRRRALKYVSGGYRPRYDTVSKKENEMTKEEIQALIKQTVAQELGKAEVQALVKQAVTQELAERDTVTAQVAQKVSPWAEEAWNKAVAEGLFDGTRPSGTITREQVALVLERFAKLHGLTQ